MQQSVRNDIRNDMKSTVLSHSFFLHIQIGSQSNDTFKYYASNDMSF